MKKRFVSLFFIVSAMAFLSAESEGEKQFKANNPSGAAVLLESEIQRGEISADTYNFPGLPLPSILSLSLSAKLSWVKVMR